MCRNCIGPNKCVPYDCDIEIVNHLLKCFSFVASLDAIEFRHMLLQFSILFQMGRSLGH